MKRVTTSMFCGYSVRSNNCFRFGLHESLLKFLTIKSAQRRRNSSPFSFQKRSDSVRNGELLKPLEESTDLGRDGYPPAVVTKDTAAVAALDAVETTATGAGDGADPDWKCCTPVFRPR